MEEIEKTKNYRLGINTGFALNRFPMPEQWMKVVGHELGIKYVQLTADLINPSLGPEIINNYITRINKCRKEYNIEIDSVMTGAFTRVNHFSSPDEKTRRFWIDWFKKLIDVALAIGANNVSSHFGILSYEDLHNKERRDFIFQETVNAWKELAVYGKEKGLSYLSWEPMSIAREYGETIKETKIIQKHLSDSKIPIYLCLDVDHGDLSSTNPDDTNPYEWIKEFAKITPLIHLKQSLIDKGGHYPFIEEYNSQGIIVPSKIIDALDSAEALKNTLLLLELSFREREPTDSNVLAHLKESVNYWRKYVETIL